MGCFFELMNLYLEAIALGDEHAGADREAGLFGPALQLLGGKSQPQVSAMLSGLRLIVGTEFAHNEAAIRR